MSVQLHILPGIPLVRAGDDLVALISDALACEGITAQEGDVFVLAQKIVSKAEGRLVKLSTIQPSARSLELAEKTQKDPRLVELVLRQSASILFANEDTLLVEHKLGFVMPNAGIDLSNVNDPNSAELALLLPIDPEGSARRLRIRLCKAFGVPVAVVINDSVSRPWRAGTCGVALGVAGLPVLSDQRGRTDLLGRELKFTVTGFADEIAAAASLVMGQGSEGTPVIVVRGLKYPVTKDPLQRPSEITPHLVSRV